MAPFLGIDGQVPWMRWLPAIPLAGLLVCSWALLGCQTAPPRALAQPMPVPEGWRPDTAQPAPFETPPVFAAGEVLDPDALRADYYVVEGEVVNDGMANHYAIQSDFGRFRAAGTEMALKRIREVHALYQLHEMQGGSAAGKGLQQELESVATSPFRRLKKVVTNPLYAVAAIPSEVFKVYGVLNDTRKLMQSGFSKEAFNEYVGFSSAKDDLARYLGLEPSTTNLVLQAKLFEVAKSYYAGGAPLRLAEDFAPGVPMPVLEVGDGGGSVGKGLDAILDEFSPRNTKNRLRAMKVPRAVRKSLYGNPWVTGRSRGGMVKALWRVKDAENRVSFVEAACTAYPEDRGFYFRRLAELMAAYHERTASITHVYMTPWDIPIGLCEDERYAAFFYADHLAWTEETACIVDALSETIPEEHEAGSGEIVIAGSVSDRARFELEAQGYTVFDDALNMLDAHFEFPKARGLKALLSSELEEAPRPEAESSPAAKPRHRRLSKKPRCAAKMP